MKKFVLMVVALMGFAFAQAQSVVENYNAATKAVEAKDYAKAAQLFESVISEGSEEEDETIAGCVKNAQNNLPVVYTRLGSAAAGAASKLEDPKAKDAKFAEAIAHLEKAVAKAKSYRNTKAATAASTMIGKVYIYLTDHCRSSSSSLCVTVRLCLCNSLLQVSNSLCKLSILSLWILQLASSTSSSRTQTSIYYWKIVLCILNTSCDSLVLLLRALADYTFEQLSSLCIILCLNCLSSCVVILYYTLRLSKSEAHQRYYHQNKLFHNFELIKMFIVYKLLFQLIYAQHSSCKVMRFFHYCKILAAKLSKFNAIAEKNLASRPHTPLSGHLFRPQSWGVALYPAL